MNYVQMMWLAGDDVDEKGRPSHTLLLLRQDGALIRVNISQDQFYGPDAMIWEPMKGTRAADAIIGNSNRLVERRATTSRLADVETTE